MTFQWPNSSIKKVGKLDRLPCFTNRASTFFFLAFGRCRSEARSLHEHKQSERHLYKDPVGPSKLANQNKPEKHKTNNHDDPQIPQPDLRFVKRKQQTRQKTGQGPNKKQPQQRFAKGHSGFTTVPLHKNLQNRASTLYGETCFIIGPHPVPYLCWPATVPLSSPISQ